MPHYTDYRCGQCGKTCLRDLLVVKKIVFAKLGAGGKTVRSRTKVWLCPDCLEVDPDYKTQAFDAPGMKSGPLERVRELQAMEEQKAA